MNLIGLAVVAAGMAGSLIGLPLLTATIRSHAGDLAANAAGVAVLAIVGAGAALVIRRNARRAR